MKLLINIIILLALPFILSGQDPTGNYNPYVNSGTISPSPLLPLQENGTGTISFNIGNSGSDPLDVFTDQYITLTITLSYGEPDNDVPLDAVSGTAAGLFSWTYSSGTFKAVQISAIASGYSGSISIDYKVTQNSNTPGYNGFNVNIAPAPYQTDSNTPDDDAVSSYTYTEARDYGDAPESYGSAYHSLDYENYLGNLIDWEESNQSSASADGDDLNGIDDEDGVAFPAEIHREDIIQIPVTVTGAGRLNAWIDWNGDGDFEDPDEQVAANLTRAAGTQNLEVTVPADAIISAPTFARFRFSPGSISSSTGAATGGEVEDYQITILCAPPTITFSSSDADNTFCEGTLVSFTAGGGSNYNFRVDGMSVQNGTATSYETDALSDGQTVDVIVADEFGCSATSEPIINTVNPLPDIVITEPDTACSPSTVDLSDPAITEGSTSGLTYTYWLDRDASISYDSPFEATTGKYYIKGTVPSTGCYSIDSVNVVVNPTPPAPVVSVVDNCDGTSVLSTETTGALLWSNGDVSSSITVTEAGTYSVTTTLVGCTSDPGSAIAAPKTAPDAPVVSEASLSNSCPEETVDLTALVTSTTPAGGVLLYKTVNDPNGEDIPDPAAVGSGTYYLFYQNVDECYSTGTEVNVSIINCPADLTPTLIVSPNIMHGVTGFDLTVKVTELNMMDTEGSITVIIPKDPRWTLPDGYDPSLTALGGTVLNNGNWTHSEDAVNHIFTSNVVIPAGGFSTFGFRVSFDPGSTRGFYSITAQILSGGGGEIRVSNNADSEKIDYFQE